jgi:hypothetical protein
VRREALEHAADRQMLWRVCQFDTAVLVAEEVVCGAIRRAARDHRPRPVGREMLEPGVGGDVAGGVSR